MSKPPPPLWTQPWQLARRSWLKLASAAAVLASAGALWWVARKGSRPLTVAETEAAMLKCIVDILVPRDDTPGAVELGVHDHLQQVLRTDTSLATACSELYQALDRSARTKHQLSFLDLELKQQDALMQALAAAGRGGLGWPGLMLMRERTLQLYYAQPASWPALGLTGAPQPVGFMDYSQEPKRRS